MMRLSLRCLADVCGCRRRCCRVTLGAGSGSGMMMHMRDWFDWLSLVAIPGLVGVGTLAVSVVALIASNRAQALSREIEAQRGADELRRDQDTRLGKLQGMAIEEARALHRMISERVRPRPARTPVGISGASVPDRSAADEARREAEVMLRQSIVPGAEPLLELTLFDLTNRWSMLPANETEWSPIRKAIVAERHERTVSRIRDWALNPELESERIGADWAMAQTDALRYLLMGKELTWDIDYDGPTTTIHLG